MEKRYFTTSDYNKFTSNALDAKIAQKKFIEIETLAKTKETKTWATKAELKTEQDKIVNLQTYDLSLFIGQSYFNNDGAQFYLLFQLLCYTLKILGNNENFISWKSKSLFDEKLTNPTTTDNILSLSINWYGNSKFCLIIKGSCLK